MQAIYETRGRAREFCELAMNLYRGCGHRCVYCYGPDVIKQDADEFWNNPIPRNGILRQLTLDAYSLSKKNEQRSILLCFTTDPYQPIDTTFSITRKAIQILHAYNLKVTILTKGGNRALRDFDLLKPGMDTFATTLTLLNDALSKEWEPGAASPSERIAVLKKAHDEGIETWVSLEPVIHTETTKRIIELTHNFVGHYKVGKMNYHPRHKQIDWHHFANQIIVILNAYNCKYYIKTDLAVYLNKTEGFWGG